MAVRNRKKRERRFTKRMQIKLLAVFAFVLLALILVLGRIVYINVKSGQRYAKQVRTQEDYDSEVLYSRRGEIRDTNGRLLAYSEKVYNVVLDCVEINRNEDRIDPTIDALVEVFDLDRSDLRDRITGETTRSSQYQVILEKIPEEQKEAFEEYTSLDADRDLTKEERAELELVSGVWFEDKYIRRYPMDSLASEVIGFSNEIGDGICGIESYYDSRLKGTNGRVFGYLNQNQEFHKRTIPPENGYTLQTTIDVNIQQIVEKYIAEFDEEYGEDRDNGTAKRGAKDLGVVIMNPNTGAVLSMATNRGFNPNEPQDMSAYYTESEVKSMTTEQYEAALSAMWSNYCVSDAIEPGSTFKPITVASALECGAVTENDSFYCDGGEFITDTEIHCDAWPNSHGDETLGDVLKNSCNDGLMQIGAAMGVTNFIKYQDMFNFGNPTGIDLPNESAGAVYTQEKMNEVELATCTFGQGLACTMIQEIAAFSTVVNGGYYYQPHVVDKIFNESGKLMKDSSSLMLKQNVSTGVSETVRGYLETAVKEGTGRTAQVPGYRVGGKTGTAEKIDPETKMRAKGKYLVSFIGSVPINDPEVVIYVVVDEPNVENQASSTYAQELFQKIALEVLPYMGIYPTEDVDNALLAQLGLTPEDLGEETVHTFQAFDSNGTLYNDARVKNGKVLDGSGNEIAGAYIDESGNVMDGWGNHVSTVETEPVIDPKVDNPDMALPPEENENGAQEKTSAVWDGTAVDEEDQDQ